MQYIVIDVLNCRSIGIGVISANKNEKRGKKMKDQYKDIYEAIIKNCLNGNNTETMKIGAYLAAYPGELLDKIRITNDRERDLPLVITISKEVWEENPVLFNSSQRSNFLKWLEAWFAEADQFQYTVAACLHNIYLADEDNMSGDKISSIVLFMKGADVEGLIQILEATRAYEDTAMCLSSTIEKCLNTVYSLGQIENLSQLIVLIEEGEYRTPLIKKYLRLRDSNCKENSTIWKHLLKIGYNEKTIILLNTILINVHSLKKDRLVLRFLSGCFTNKEELSGIEKNMFLRHIGRTFGRKIESCNSTLEYISNIENPNMELIPTLNWKFFYEKLNNFNGTNWLYSFDMNNPDNFARLETMNSKKLMDFFLNYIMNNKSDVALCFQTYNKVNESLNLYNYLFDSERDYNYRAFKKLLENNCIALPPVSEIKNSLYYMDNFVTWFTQHLDSKMAVEYVLEWSRYHNDIPRWIEFRDSYSTRNVFLNNYTRSYIVSIDNAIYADYLQYETYEYRKKLFALLCEVQFRCHPEHFIGFLVAFFRKKIDHTKFIELSEVKKTIVHLMDNELLNPDIKIEIQAACMTEEEYLVFTNAINEEKKKKKELKELLELQDDIRTSINHSLDVKDDYGLRKIKILFSAWRNKLQVPDADEATVKILLMVYEKFFSNNIGEFLTAASDLFGATLSVSVLEKIQKKIELYIEEENESICMN